MQMFENFIDETGPIHQELSKVYTRKTNKEAVYLAVLLFMY